MIAEPDGIMKTFFHQPQNPEPEQPQHGARYYLLLGAGLLMLGLLYLWWAL
ncbi:MAG: hypothetical protein ACRER6_13350 [Pseudomonas sp.]